MKYAFQIKKEMVDELEKTEKFLKLESWIEEKAKLGKGGGNYIPEEPFTDADMSALDYLGYSITLVKWDTEFEKIISFNITWAI